MKTSEAAGVCSVQRGLLYNVIAKAKHTHTHTGAPCTHAPKH